MRKSSNRANQQPRSNKNNTYNTYNTQQRTHSTKHGARTYLRAGVKLRGRLHRRDGLSHVAPGQVDDGSEAVLSNFHLRSAANKRKKSKRRAPV